MLRRVAAPAPVAQQQPVHGPAHGLVGGDALHPGAADGVGGHRARGLPDDLRQVDPVDHLLRDADQVDLRQGRRDDGLEVDALEDDGGEVEAVQDGGDDGLEVDALEDDGGEVEAVEDGGDDGLEVDALEDDGRQVHAVQDGGDDGLEVDALEDDGRQVHAVQDGGDDGVEVDALEDDGGQVHAVQDAVQDRRHQQVESPGDLGRDDLTPLGAGPGEGVEPARGVQGLGDPRRAQRQPDQGSGRDGHGVRGPADQPPGRPGEAQGDVDGEKRAGHRWTR